MMDSLEDSLTESFEAIAVQPGPSTSTQTMTNAERWSKFKANLSEEKKAELREKDRLRKAKKNAQRSVAQRKVFNLENQLAVKKFRANMEEDQREEVQRSDQTRKQVQRAEMEEDHLAEERERTIT